MIDLLYALDPNTYLRFPCNSRRIAAMGKQGANDVARQQAPSLIRRSSRIHSTLTVTNTGKPEPPGT